MHEYMSYRHIGVWTRHCFPTPPPLRGSYWATARRAMVPVFHTDKLRNFGVVMHACSRTLLDRLKAAAEKGEPIDVAPLLQVRVRGG